MPEIIVVGIAYGAYPGREGNNRTRDFTPTAVQDFPSIWWDDDVTFKLEQKYAETHDDMPASVFISVGDVEGTAPACEKLVQILKNRNYAGLKPTSMVFEDAPHLTAFWRVYDKGGHMSALLMDPGRPVFESGNMMRGTTPPILANGIDWTSEAVLVRL